jgi:serine/threonine protein kinase
VRVRNQPAYDIQVFRKASHDSIDLISALLEYTPTQRLSAIDAMVQPFFDELRDPSTRLPDSRHSNGAPRELPNLFDFSRHGSFPWVPPPPREHLNMMLITNRTFNSSTSQQQIGSSACPRCAGCSWSRHRQFHASYQRRNDGTTRLSPTSFECLTK